MIRLPTSRAPWADHLKVMAQTRVPADSNSSRPSTRSLNQRFLSVVIPAFNEESLIDRCLVETSQALLQLGCKFEIIVIDDGSSDKTAELARDTARTIRSVRVIRQLRNTGKGYALLLGASQAEGDLVAFVDADLEVHPNQLGALYETLSRSHAEAAIGSKHHPDAQVDLGFFRYRLSVIYSQLVRAVFHLPVHDTQTGLKIFLKEPLQQALVRSRVNRFAYDLELLVGLTKMGYRVVEMPVTVTSVRLAQRIRARDVGQMAIDSFLIWFRTELLHQFEIDSQLTAQYQTQKVTKRRRFGNSFSTNIDDEEHRPSSVGWPLG